MKHPLNSGSNTLTTDQITTDERNHFSRPDHNSVVYNYFVS